MKILLASPRGFCAGVVRAIETVEQTIEKHGKPVYVLHEIVHNKHVIQELEEKGAVFVEELNEIPRGNICIFSAHGVSKETVEDAHDLGLRTIDATCPLVSSVHRVVEKYFSEGYEIVIIGHHKHPEVEATAGRVAGNIHVIATEEEAQKLVLPNSENVAYVTQTTLSQEDISGIREVLKNKFPNIKGQSSNICFATQNRQDAVRAISARADLVFVVGSKNSSNSNRLREVAERTGCKAYLIDDSTDIEEQWLSGIETIGITAGASAPERLVQGVISWCQERGQVEVEEIEGKEENVYFTPAELREENAEKKPVH